MQKTLLVFIAGIFLSSLLNAQSDSIPNFEFEYMWGTYGHYKVSSKENKVFIKVQHPNIYADTGICFNYKDRKQIWEKIQAIDFMNYPDDFSPCKVDIEPKFAIDLNYQYDSVSELFYIDSSKIDTLWDPILIMCSETTIPYSEYSISIYLRDEVKTINWKGGIEIYTFENGEKKYIENPKYNNLYELGGLIGNITRQKQGYKNLPNSNLMYE